MAFNFPDSPAVGDTHTEAGVEYQYVGDGIWNLAGGGDMIDYVLKAGDTMTGPLTTEVKIIASGGIQIGTTAYAITLTSFLQYDTFNQHKFFVNGIEKARIEGGNAFVGQGHIYAQSGGRFIHSRSADGDRCFETYAAWIISRGGNNEGKFEFWTANGGWSDVCCFSTLIGSGGGGIWVRGAGITNDGALRQGGGISCGAKVGANAQDCSKHIVLWEGASGNDFGFNITNASLNYVVDSIASSHSFYAGTTLCYQIDEVGAVGNSVNVTAPEALAVGRDLGLACDERGLDLAKALAACLAKIKALEAKIDLLEKRK